MAFNYLGVCMKNYLLLLVTCFIFANNQYPTESQINQMIEQ